MNHGNNAKICSRNLIPRGHSVHQVHAVIHFLVFKAQGAFGISHVVQHADSENEMFTAIRNDWATVVLKALEISEIL
jgi:hypothetical protein